MSIRLPNSAGHGQLLNFKQLFNFNLKQSLLHPYHRTVLRENGWRLE